MRSRPAPPRRARTTHVRTSTGLEPHREPERRREPTLLVARRRLVGGPPSAATDRESPLRAMRLLSVFETSSPLDASAITDALYVAARPRRHHVVGVRDLRIDLVISMIWFRPARELMRAPFAIVRLPTADSPLFPIPLWMLRRGVEAALRMLHAGGRVLVYCRAGRHRSVAMACCILIGRGMTANEAMRLVVARRPIADPHAPHIEKRILAFERDWRLRHEPTLPPQCPEQEEGARPTRACAQEPQSVPEPSQSRVVRPGSNGNTYGGHHGCQEEDARKGQASGIRESRPRRRKRW